MGGNGETRVNPLRPFGLFILPGPVGQLFQGYDLKEQRAAPTPSTRLFLPLPSGSFPFTLYNKCRGASPQASNANVPDLRHTLQDSWSISDTDTSFGQMSTRGSTWFNSCFTEPK